MASSSSSASRDTNDVITINEKVDLTKQPHQVLKIICDTYEISVSEYMQQALVEAMKFDIEEGNFSDTLLEKIGKNSVLPSTKSSYHQGPFLKWD